MIRFSGTYSAHLFGRGRIILTEDPGFIEYILRENHTNYQKSELSTQTAARLFGKGLLFSNGEPWLKQRRLIQPGFHQRKIQGLYTIVSRTAADFISKFPTGNSIDVYPLMHDLSFSVLIHSLFDIHLADHRIAELSEGFTLLQDFLFKDINQPFRKILYPFNRAEENVLRKAENIRNIIRGIIQARRMDNLTHNDLLDMLLSARYEDSGLAMSEDQLVDEVLVFLFAGHETTANSLSWLLYLIAANRDTAEKLKSAIEKTDIYDSPRNEYINAVISEGMRLYPAAWMTERVSIRDDAYNGFSYPGGTIVIPFFYGLHRNKKYWEQESVFNPERFISANPAIPKKIKNFFPFGAGPRMCIGNHFAIAEMAIILHLFFRSFEVSITGEIPRMWPLITLRPRKLILQVSKASS